MTHSENLTTNLRLLRQFHKLSSTDLSLKLGMNDHRILDIEAQKRVRIRDEELEAIAQYFKVTVNDLVNGIASINFTHP